MSYITEFSIDGLSGRKTPYAHRLNRNVNIFFGVNGSGKTSLLKIFHSAMDGDASRVQAVPFTSARVRIHSENYKKNFTLSLSKTRVSAQTILDEPTRFPSGVTIGREYLAMPRRESPPVWKTKPRLPGRKQRIRWQHLYLPTARLYTSSDVVVRPVRYIEDRTDRYSEEQLDQLFAQSLQDLWSSFSSPLLAKVRHAQEAGLARILKDVLKPSTQRSKHRPQDSDTTYRRVATFLRRQGSPRILGTPAQFRKRYREDPNLQSVAADINSIEEEIEQALKPREQLQKLISAMFTGAKEVSLEDNTIRVRTHDGSAINLASLSSGEKHALRIFIDVLQAEESTMIIDEPEISLHVDWQRTLISNMRLLNPSAQLIVATHSPEVMADIPDEKIFRL